MSLILRVIRLFLVRLLGIVLALAISFLLAAKFGAGAETDAFFLARRVVTGFVEAMARGLSFIFVPIFVIAFREDQTGHTARRSLIKLSTYGLLIGMGITMIAFWLAPTLVSILGGSFDDTNLDMATAIFKIFLISIPICLVAMIATTYFEAQDQFSFPAFMRHMSRILLLVVLLLFIPPFGLIEASWAFSAGWVFTLIVLLVAPFIGQQKSQMTDTTNLKPELGFDAAARKRSWAMFCILIFGQLAAWVETGFAANISEGSLSLLEYGQRLGNLLPGTLAFSLLLIQFTQWVKRQEISSTSPDLIEAIVMGALIIFPVNIFIFINADVIVDLILGYGAFSNNDIETTANIIRVLVPSAFTVYLLNLIHARFVVSGNDSYLRKIIAIASIEVLLRVILLWVFVPKFGVLGLVATMSISPLIIVMIVLIFHLHAWNLLEMSNKHRRTGFAILVASISSFLAAMLINRFLANKFDNIPETMGNLLSLGVLGTCQMAIYLILVLWLGGIRQADVRKFLAKQTH